MTIRISIPTREVVSQATRQILADYHTDWDGPHWVFSMAWNAGTGQLAPLTAALITNDVPPTTYPAHLARIASEEAAGGKQAYLYMVMIEMWGVTVDPTADQAQVAQLKREHRARRLHLHPERMEIVSVFTADIHQRLWVTTKYRNRPDDIQQQFYGDPDREQIPRGNMITAIRNAAAIAKAA
ncbi:hypothetical protein [Protofrankia coriariae]|uniref:Uncharacterized protein n=1 Tax=Protofrankia coriariae TaxID=1562887 RepID=A0ABR5F4A8_9ACTN|nr:hypothetical protein [Protofrankia coriariae]KLL11560.1 hypothetical protein FrCorBMG51_11005 [Protofrankia coriariae]